MIIPDTNKTHELKILPEFYEAAFTGRKRFELRKDDRDFHVGDGVMLREWNGDRYTGRSYYCLIKYVLRDCEEYGLKPGYCIIGF